MKNTVAIIGGGIVGLATARQMLLRFPQLRVVLLEKESEPGRHQTGHNSGVLHCGLYYKPGSRKARMAVQGIRRMVEFCQEHNVPYRLCGKLVVATEKEELPRLDALLERGMANGLRGLEKLGPEQIAEWEPHAAGIAAIRVPEEGIVDYRAVSRALAEEIGRLGGEVRFEAEVRKLSRKGSWRIETSGADCEADFLINCAGLQSDRVSRLAGNRDPAKIVPFRGEYYRIRREREHLVTALIYPVPDPKLPFLGVHFTRQIGGGVEAGPNAVLAFAREGYRFSDISPRDLLETLTYSGFRRFLQRHAKLCWDEFRRSFSKRLFCQSLQRLVPELQMEDLEAGGAGVRAQALSPSGDLLQDFYFVRQSGALHVLNAPSPAATACLAIADEVIDMARKEIPA